MRYQATRLAFLLLLSSCASDIANRYYLSEKYPAKDPKEVEILKKRPAKDFIVIADFQSRGESEKDMQKRAASVGADAVIVAILGGYYDQGEAWADKDRMSNTYSRITGTAIKYKQGDAK